MDTYQINDADESKIRGNNIDKNNVQVPYVMHIDQQNEPDTAADSPNISQVIGRLIRPETEFDTQPDNNFKDDDDDNDAGKDFQVDSDEDGLNDTSQNGQEQTGRWTHAEHELFLEALKKYGREWKKVAAMVKTRTVVQTRTHAQKYFQKYAKFHHLDADTAFDSQEPLMKTTGHKRDTSVNSNSIKVSIKKGVPPLPISASAALAHLNQPKKKIKLSDSGLYVFEAPQDDTFAIPDSLNFAQPSPAACGRRKNAELIAATMLANSNSATDLEGIELLSSLSNMHGSTAAVHPSLQSILQKALSSSSSSSVTSNMEMITPGAMNSKKYLIINPDSANLLTPGRAESVPSTPWDSQMRILNVNNFDSDTFHSSVEFQTYQTNARYLIQSGAVDTLEILLRELSSFTHDKDAAEIVLQFPNLSADPLKAGMAAASKLFKLGQTLGLSTTNIVSDILTTPFHDGRSLFLEACVADFPDPEELIRCRILFILLGYGSTLLATDTKGNNCLHLLASKGFYRSGRMVITSGCIVNATNKDGNTALHISARLGYIEFILLLFEFGANCHIRNKRNRSAIDVACTNAQASTRAEVRKCMLTAEPRLRTLILYHDDCLDHVPRSDWDWECPDRLRDIMNRLQDRQVFPEHELAITSHFDKASVELLRRVHSVEYISFVDALSRQVKAADNANNMLPFTPQVQKRILNASPGHLKNPENCDTSFSVGTLQAARRAAGAVAHAVDHVLLGRNKNAFCVVRPPGHHSGYEGLLSDAKSCGFCIFNNVAAGALHALEEHNCERVAIVDVDVHHGNGTEDIVRRYPNPSRLFFFSVHLYDRPESPASPVLSGRMGDDSLTDTQGHALVSAVAEAGFEFFPGSGARDDTEHNIINVPLMPNWKRKSTIPHSGLGRVGEGQKNSSSSDSENNVHATSSGGSSSLDDSSFNDREPMTGRELYRQAIQQRLLPSLRAFNPSLILISMGFDTAQGDVGNMRTTAYKAEIGMDLQLKDFEWTTVEIMKIADLCCAGRVVSVLEGGYGAFNVDYKPKPIVARAHTRSTDPNVVDKFQETKEKEQQRINRDVLASAAAAHVRRLVDPYADQGEMDSNSTF